MTMTQYWINHGDLGIPHFKKPPNLRFHPWKWDVRLPLALKRLEFDSFFWQLQRHKWAIPAARELFVPQDKRKDKNQLQLNERHLALHVLLSFARFLFWWYRNGHKKPAEWQRSFKPRSLGGHQVSWEMGWPQMSTLGIGGIRYFQI
jgi:hypothetical protein